MNDQPSAQVLMPPLSEAAIAADDFHRARAANLARWPTGAEIDFAAGLLAQVDSVAAFDCAQRHLRIVE